MTITKCFGNALRALALLCASAAQAQDAGTDAAATSTLIAPELQSPSAPPYPAGATTAASVQLELSIDVNGKATASTITRSAGEPFDNAATRFASELHFSPALRDGQPIAALIPFQIDFSPPPPPIQPPPTAAPPPPPLIGSVELEVRGTPPAREPTRRSLEREEVRTIAGTNGDVLRSVETMPGVARPSPLDGVLVVRGAAPNDTQVFVDGTPIPLAYHFGGISSVIPGDVLDRLDFYPGNFGAQFGRGMGGVIDAGLRAPRSDRAGGLLQLDAIDGRLLIETPLGAHTRVLLAARRSWVDAWLGPALDGADVSVNAAPVYYDSQLVLEQDLGSRTRARLSLFGADDRFALLVKTPAASDPGQGGKLSSGVRFLRTQLRVDSQLTDHARFTNMLSWGYTNANTQLGGGHFRYGIHEINARSELRWVLTRWLTWTAGVDLAYWHYDVDLDVTAYSADNAAPAPTFAQPSRSARVGAPMFRPALYTGFELTPIAALKLLPSLRADYSDDTGNVTIDPRLSVRWDVVRAPRRTTLKGGIGLYHQAPQPQESIQPFGSTSIRSSSALHTSLGVEQELAHGFDVSIEGFYKRLEDLVVARADEARLIGARFDNTGDGRAYGAELLLRYKPVRGRFSGWIAYTMSRSERRDNGSGDYYTFAYDQTHILSAVASLTLGRGWSLGGRFRYVTGNPFTPYVGGAVDLDAGTYAALSGTQPNSARVAAFHQLDLRIEKLWELSGWKLTAYLELRNAYNRANPEAVVYNYDYSQRKPVAGLPILPVLGVRGEL